MYQSRWELLVHHRITVHIDEHGSSSGKNNQIRSGNPCHCRCDDLVAGADVKGFERKVHPGVCRRQPYSFPAAHVIAESLLELGGLRTCGNPPGTQNLADRGNIRLSYRWPWKWQKFTSHLLFHIYWKIIRIALKTCQMLKKFQITVKAGYSRNYQVCII